MPSAEDKKEIIQKSDEELMKDLKNGIISSFKILMERYNKAITVFAYSYLRDNEATKDVIQETFLEVYKMRKKYKPTAKFSTWLYTITRSRCLNVLRHQKRHPSESLQYETANPEKKGSIGDNLEQEEMKTELKKAIDLLPYLYKEVVIMREYENLSYKEISEISGYPESTLRTRMEYALDKLKEVITKNQTFSKERC
ncbi:MAG: hypothetical protein A2231_07900 [Candidatus Firestonebacteria bacterium RIFOXYA2_FULL_40_8]|nr:MAG: hypothetical protein A2231_07900 [Candidatus Firestonebacteria bacterium RIFOXYA2_FULL_40_8]